MFDEDYLTLRLDRLKSPKEWTPKREGLSCLFPNGGAGEYVSGRVAKRLSPGDVLVLNGRRAGKLRALKRGEAPVSRNDLVSRRGSVGRRLPSPKAFTKANSKVGAHASGVWVAAPRREPASA